MSEEESNQEKNKLVIIGNGFDLAHELDTSYAHFLNWLLDKILVLDKKHPLYDYTFSNLNDKFKLLDPKSGLHVSNSELFRELISQYKENDKSRWVDIEAVYFSTLTKYFNLYKRENNTYKAKELKRDVNKLNADLLIIKNELGEYLESISEKPIVFDSLFVNEFSNDNKPNKTKGEKTLFLNFNYTSTLSLYKTFYNRYNAEEISIHGKLNNITNPIIFGYGDEMNPYHQEIVDLNMNELFTHFKSFKYAQNENYHNLLLFLQKPFDVYILGHSCGLSDRVLFSTIFNDENCKEIFPFYYVNGEGEDDFTEKTFELSRHFNSAADFRKKVQPKTKCARI